MYIEDIKEDSSWLMKGDCLERMKEIPDGSVDLILQTLLMVQQLVNGIVLYH